MDELRHTAHDGRPPRRAFLNGIEIPEVMVADIRRGEIIFAPQPVRVMKNGDRVYTRKLKGVVTVEYIDGP